MKDNRPINLDFTTIKLPLAAKASITHRVSGIFLFVGMAFILYLLDLSLHSESEFMRVQALLSRSLVKLLTFAVLVSLIYHFIAGCKHLLLDLGIGESNEGAKIGAVIVLAFSVGGSVIVGLWLW